MKFLLAFFTSFIFSLVAISQNFNPTVLVLSPNKVNSTLNLESENKKLKENCQKGADREEEQTKTASFELREPNIKLITQSHINFLRNITIEKYPSYLVLEMLTYRFLHYSNFKDDVLLTASSKTCADNIDSLRQISKDTKNQFIVNIPEISFYTKKGKKYAEIAFQIYDQLSDSIVFSKTAKGSEENNGFEYTCEEGSIYCCINNAFGSMEQGILQAIGTHISINKSLENSDATNTKDILWGKMNNRPINRNFLDKCIDFGEQELDPSTIYYQLFNSDSTEIIVLTLLSADESEYFDFCGLPYRAFNYNGKWYVEKGTLSCFPAKNMEDAKNQYLMSEIGSDYFLPHSNSENPDFWNMDFFEKAESQMEKHKEEVLVYQQHLNDPNASLSDKETCRYMLEDFQEEDRENKGYFGIYLAVIDELKEQEEIAIEQFEANFGTTTVQAFYDSIIGTHDIASVKNIRETATLVFPPDRSIIIVPAKVIYKNKTETMKYYAFMKTAQNTYDVYEWSYFVLRQAKYDSYPDLFDSQFARVMPDSNQYTVPKNEAFDYPDFWTNKVLLQENGTYKYLKKVQ